MLVFGNKMNNFVGSQMISVLHFVERMFPNLTPREGKNNLVRFLLAQEII